MDKEKWIEDILQTSRQIPPVVVNPFMATRVEAALRRDYETAASAVRLPLRWVWLSAAALAVIVALNVWAWSRSQPAFHTGIQAVMQEYGWSGQRFYSADF